MAEEDPGPMEGTATLLLSFSSTVPNSPPTHAPTVGKTTVCTHPRSKASHANDRPFFNLEFL